MKGDQQPELTRRESQVLELVAQGYSAKEVAQEINIAPRTVEGHIDAIKLKLRARNRAHMVTKAIASHILTICGEQTAPDFIANAAGRLAVDAIYTTTR